MLGHLNETEIENVLFSHLVGRIGCHHDNTTYIVPISYAYDGTYIYCHTRPGMKVDIMRKNPRICFEVDNVADMANWSSVISWGNYEELSGEDREVALKYLVERILPIVSSETTHLSPLWPFPPKNLQEIKGIVFRVKLENKSGRFEKKETEEG